jgi:uncharacterized protein YycO
MAKSLCWRVVGADDFISRSIKFISRGPVSHVEFLVDGGANTIGAHADGGVQIRPIGYAKYSVDLRFEATCSDQQYAKASAFLQAQIGKPYDLIDIAAILANRNWRDPNRWICSELWAAVLEEAELIGKINSSINLFTPEDSLVVSSAMFGGCA